MPRKTLSFHKILFDKEFFTSIPYLAMGKTVNNVLSNYFEDERLRICFCFQSKYLGMSPWECPGAFSMISYVEHEFSIYHVVGGLSEISSAMARIIEEFGGKIYLDRKVKKIICDNKVAKGILLEDGEKVYADAIVINADFGYAMTTLFEEGLLKNIPGRTSKRKNFLVLHSCFTSVLIKYTMSLTIPSILQMITRETPMK